MGTNKETIPLVLHSAWSPTRHDLVDAERLTFASEVSDEALATVPEELRASVWAVVDELG